MSKELREYRRKQYLVDKKFQPKVIWSLVAVVVSSILVSHFITVMFLKMKEWLDASSPELMYFTNPVQHSLNFARLLDVLWVPMLISALIGSLLSMVFALYYSHRIAGPLFNLKRMMHEVTDGNVAQDMHIRKTDEFHDVEEGFNRMLQNLRDHLNRLKNIVGELSEQDKKKIISILNEWKIEITPDKK